MKTPKQYLNQKILYKHRFGRRQEDFEIRKGIVVAEDFDDLRPEGVFGGDYCFKNGKILVERETKKGEKLYASVSLEDVIEQ